MFTLFQKNPKMDEVFGPPYAVVNLSKVGLRYFRLLLHISPASLETLAHQLTGHPNVGWVLSAEGWFNLGVGVWARDNAEINDISSQLRVLLRKGDEVIYQSELTSLYSFGNRAIGRSASPMAIVDSTIHPVELSPLELDYIKLVTLDSSLPAEELAELLAISKEDVEKMRERLESSEVIVGTQERINYAGLYFKVFIDTSSSKTPDTVSTFLKELWSDSACVYVERANGKYDLEFELILPHKSDIKKYVEPFGEYQTAILTKNIYTNLYPLSKIANMCAIQDAVLHQSGPVIDLRNSKLWYLNYAGADAYLNIYKNRAYFEVMEKGELDLFDEIASYLQKQSAAMYHLIDIGSGDGLKGRIFIEKLGEKSVKAYYPIDIQPIELAVALKSHEAGSYAKHPTLLDIENLSARFPLKTLPGEKQVYIVFGGTYGNFTAEKINAQLRPLVAGQESILLVAMPILSGGKKDTEIIPLYTNEQVENVAFGPLAQMGFEKADFEPNKDKPGLIVHIDIEEKRLISSVVLKNDVEKMGRMFKKGTVFQGTTSWKPTLDEFQAALEQNFIIEKMFANKDMAIALINKTK